MALELDKLTDDEIILLKEYFIKSKLIKMSDIIAPIEQYFFKLDLNNDTQSFELYMGVPKDWLHDMTMGDYKIELVAESEGGKIIKLVLDSEESVAEFDELIGFATDIIDRNTAILAKIREKESELAKMKEQMIQKQLELSQEIENMKKIIKEGEEEEEDDGVSEGVNDGANDGVNDGVKEEVATVVAPPVKPQIYRPPKQQSV